MKLIVKARSFPGKHMLRLPHTTHLNWYVLMHVSCGLEGNARATLGTSPLNITYLNW